MDNLTELGKIWKEVVSPDKPGVDDEERQTS